MTCYMTSLLGASRQGTDDSEYLQDDTKLGHYEQGDIHASDAVGVLV